jgi:predicted Co/Zn/Cd cation transporter (cation efflux family)
MLQTLRLYITRVMLCPDAFAAVLGGFCHNYSIIFDGVCSLGSPAILGLKRFETIQETLESETICLMPWITIQLVQASSDW